MILKHFLMGFCAVFLCACATQKLDVQNEQVFVRIKSPEISVAATAFIQRNLHTIIAQIYSVATPIGTLKITKHSVCFDSKCFKNSTFNKRILGIFSDEDVMFKIFTRQRIKEFDKAKISEYAPQNYEKYIKHNNELLITPNQSSLKTKRALVVIKPLR